MDPSVIISDDNNNNNTNNTNKLSETQEKERETSGSISDILQQK